MSNTLAGVRCGLTEKQFNASKNGGAGDKSALLLFMRFKQV